MEKTYGLIFSFQWLKHIPFCSNDCRMKHYSNFKCLGCFVVFFFREGDQVFLLCFLSIKPCEWDYRQGCLCLNSPEWFTEEEQFYCYLGWVWAVMLLNILLHISADSDKRKLESVGIDAHLTAGLAAPVVTALFQHPLPKQSAPFSAWEVRVLVGHSLKVLLSLSNLAQDFVSLKQKPSLQLPVQSTWCTSWAKALDMYKSRCNELVLWKILAAAGQIGLLADVTSDRKSVV